MTPDFSSVNVFFSDVKENVDEMIAYLANEPSLGLFFVQQHAQTSMPYLLNHKDKVREKVNELSLHTEDFEDSIGALRSMTEFGFPIADEMIKEINKSLLIMSTTQPKRGLITNSSWGFEPEQSNASTQVDHGRGYLSAALQKAAEFRWPQQNREIKGPKGNGLVTPSELISSISITRDHESDELPVSSRVSDDQYNKGASESFSITNTLENFGKFKSEREAKFIEWLQETELRPLNPIKGDLQ